jgi:hypothetical protein
MKVSTIRRTPSPQDDVIHASTFEVGVLEGRGDHAVVMAMELGEEGIERVRVVCEMRTRAPPSRRCWTTCATPWTSCGRRADDFCS